MTELGLRYRPLATADQEAHAATVSLLARDLDGCDIAKLSRAAEQWARTEKFMPKACDLLGIIRRQATPSDRIARQQEICDAANSRMALDPEGRRDIHWVVRNGAATLEWVRQLGGNHG